MVTDESLGITVGGSFFTTLLFSVSDCSSDASTVADISAASAGRGDDGGSGGEGWEIVRKPVIRIRSLCFSHANSSLERLKNVADRKRNLE